MNNAHTPHMTVRDVAPYMVPIKRSIILWVIICLLYRAYTHLLPVQLHAAPLTKVLYYPEFHLYKFLSLDAVLVQNYWGAFIYTALLFIIPILLFWKPQHLLLSVLFIISNLLYHTVQGVHMTHAVHFLAGSTLLSFIFLARQALSFNLLWEGLRYVVCTIYVTAFIWKFIHGAIFQWEFGEAVFKSNLATYLYLNPSGMMRSIYAYFLSHPYLLNAGTLIAFLMEGVFVVGYFTKRWDTYLIIALLLLHHLLYIFVDTLFVEWYILILPFLSLKVWKKISPKVSIGTSSFEL